jgi:hypothetical protein
MVAPESHALRNAALLLHGLPLQARERIIAKLDPAQAALLEPMLEELRSLGIPPALGEQFQQLAGSRGPSAAAAQAPTVRARVMQLSAADVATGLKSCSAVTAAQLLRADDWPWRQAALDQMTELRRAEIARRMRDDTAPLPPAILNALSERLYSEVQQLWTR